MAMNFDWTGDVKSVGLWFKQLREAQGLTQRDLEKRTGGMISPTNISQIEAGNILKVPFAMVTRVGAALGVTPNEIAQHMGVWFPSGKKTDNEPEELTFLRRVMEGQTPAQRYMLLQQVKAMAEVAQRTMERGA